MIVPSRSRTKRSLMTVPTGSAARSERRAVLID